MFCPECRSEYREGFTRCTDCDVDLVAELPALPAVDEAPRIVFTTSQPSEAALMKSVLEASGVEVFAFDEHQANITVPMATLLGDVKLAVSPEQEQLARDVLRDYQETAENDQKFGGLTAVDSLEDDDTDPDEANDR